MIDSIASLSIALSLARVQTAVATKVLKISQDQGQVAADLVSAAVENLEETIEDFAGELGTRFDAYG
jgi:hypothetical protein